jgi:5'(3')-deoxyribonucleotidase
MQRQVADLYLVAYRCACGKFWSEPVSGAEAQKRFQSVAPAPEKTKGPRPVIYVDLDGMAADLLSRLLLFHAMEGGEQLRPSETDKWSGLGLDRYLERDGVFRDLDPLAGFAEALPELQKMGEVFIASSPSRNPDSASDKVRWVLGRFPIHRRNIVLIHEKHLLRGDVFLEDWGKNIHAIRATNPASWIGAIAYPYNVDAPADLRAEGVADTRGAWRALVAGVRGHLKL